MIKKHIPNAITCGNLFCGCIGILFTSNHRLDIAFYLLVIAAVLDFFDGFAARMLRVTSAIGKDLDSLADMVTFGVLPGFIMYKMIALSILNFDFDLAVNVFTLFSIGEPSLGEFEKLHIHNLAYLFLPFIAFVIPVFSAIRLAKFNNDTRQTESFIGLPTPANGLLIASLGFILVHQIQMRPVENITTIVFNPITLSLMSLVLSILLLAPIPMFSLKFKNFGWNGNKRRFSFLMFSVLLLVFLQFLAIPLIIVSYVLFSIVSNLFLQNRPRSN